MNGRYAELLRVIGQWLDAHQAQSIELIGTVHTVTVRWRPPSGRPQERTFAADELAELNILARTGRTGGTGSMAGPWATGLRALGYEFDRTGQQLLVARSVADGVQVLGADPRMPATQWFAPERLGNWDAVQRSRRGGIRTAMSLDA